MASKKLTKGLSDIFTDIDNIIDDIDASDLKSNEVDVDSIRPNPYQPRKKFDDENLKELAQSINEHGVFQPIIIRKSIEGYELIAGERRLRASKLANKKTIPAIVVEFNDQQMMEISLLENIQRENLTAIEEAMAFDKLINQLNYTQDELAKRIAKSRPYISNMLRLLKLPEEIKQMVLKNDLSGGHARALLSIDNNEEAIALAKKVIKEGMSVRELERFLKPKKDNQKEVKEDPNLKNVCDILTHRLNTKVEVNKHRIIINYKDTEDLNRILELIDGLEK